MATVYLARDLKHNRLVALKVLRPELGAVLGADRFLREISLTAGLQHPSILPLLDSGAAGGQYFYVMPYIEGESLRQRLEREGQLPLEDALRIVREVAEGLEYAHGQGIIHRDIKPENLLLSRGHALVADFGIALAVKEAAGNRLTETGLSLGTPHYMSPEQATGERRLDARSDVYSLGAVLYEMLAGEPPLNGPTVQAVIAKLMTERPTPLLVVRDTVPPAVDAAVAKALAKVPADRFAGPAEFMQALEQAPASSERAPSPRRRARWMYGVAAAMLAALAFALTRGRAQAGGDTFLVRDRTQLTFTGSATSPAISADGKQVAYVVRNCDPAGCRSSIEVQDIGAGAGRRAVIDVPRADNLRWSFDRRFLSYRGEISGRWGTWIVPTLGGEPRLLAPPPCSAIFHPAADSLLMPMPGTQRDTIGWVAVTGLDGTKGDSIGAHFEHPGFICESYLVPNSRWAVVEMAGTISHDYNIVDRAGRRYDAFRLPQTIGTWSVMRADALWMQLWTAGFPILRVPFDARKGRFAGPADTLLTTAASGFDVTADGGTIAYGDGTNQYGLWALPMAEAVKGRFQSERRRQSASSVLRGRVSPDGTRLLRYLSPMGATGREDRQAVVVEPFAGGPERVHQSRGELLAAGWSPDGGTIGLVEQVAGQVQLVAVDASTGARKPAVASGDSIIKSFAVLPGGWAWISASDRLRLSLAGEPRIRELTRSTGEVFLWDVEPASGRPWIATMASNAAIDSVFLDVWTLPDGRPTRWASVKGSLETYLGMAWLANGSLVFCNQDAETSATIYRVRGPGQVERLATIPRALQGFSISQDGQHLVLLTDDFRGDVWLAHVGRVRSGQ
jgi:hypothetical protein